MNIARAFFIVSATAAGMALTGCAPIGSDDPCAQADRPVSFETLLQNSSLNAYEACLAEVRVKALRAMEQ